MRLRTPLLGTSTTRVGWWLLVRREQNQHDRCSAWCGITEPDNPLIAVRSRRSLEYCLTHDQDHLPASNRPLAPHTFVILFTGYIPSRGLTCVARSSWVSGMNFRCSPLRLCIGI